MNRYITPREDLNAEREQEFRYAVKTTTPFKKIFDATEVGQGPLVIGLPPIVTDISSYFPRNKWVPLQEHCASIITARV